MSKDCVSLLSWDTQAQFEVWRDAIGICGLELTRGVPMWESFYRSIQCGDRRGGTEAIYDSGLGFAARGVRDAQVDDNARVSFWRAFGITPDLQVAAETAWPGIEWCPDAPLVNIYHLPFQNVNNPLCLLSRANPTTKP